MLVPERARKCVLFVGAKPAGKFVPRATAFAVRIHDHQHLFHYLVTAEHVVSALLRKDHDIWVRANSKSGPPDEVKIGLQDWSFHPDAAYSGADVAVAPLSFDGNTDLDPVPIVGPDSVAATHDVITKTGIGVGDEAVITGLFLSHHGQQKNVPITRIGNIAMLDGEPVTTKYCGDLNAYLIEARSIGGLSGSPVFAHLPAIRTIDGKTTLPYTQASIFQLYLLGLVHGHFDIQNLNSDAVLEDGERAISGIHSGIGVVIPVEKIIETVMQPKLAKMRLKIVEDERQKTEPLLP